MSTTTTIQNLHAAETALAGLFVPDRTKLVLTGQSDPVKNQGNAVHQYTISGGSGFPGMVVVSQNRAKAKNVLEDGAMKPVGQTQTSLWLNTHETRVDSVTGQIQSVAPMSVGLVLRTPGAYGLGDLIQLRKAIDYVIGLTYTAHDGNTTFGGGLVGGKPDATILNWWADGYMALK